MSAMMTSGEEAVREGIDILPDELMMYIFKMLPLDSLLACEIVCHRWKKMVRDTNMWRHIPMVYSGKQGQNELSTKNLQIISSHCEYISCLKLQYVYSYPIIKSILNQCVSITTLELVMCRIAKDFYDDIMRWPRLKKLNLKNSLLLQNSEELVIEYGQFKYLKFLALSDFGLSPENCVTLHHCPNLTQIYIDKIRNLTLENVIDLIICKKDSLEAIHIYGGDAVNDHCLVLLSQCPALKDLAIVRCEDLTDEGLVSLKNLKQIQHLQIWNNAIFTEHNLMRVLGSPNLIKLQSLSLSRIGNISPMIVDVISEYYKNLKFLAVYQCPRIINTDYEKQLKSKFRNIDVVLY